MCASVYVSGHETCWGKAHFDVPYGNAIDIC